MLKKIGIAALIAAPLFWAAPAFAQQSAGVLLIYGNDKCPTNKDGDEIVVCQRLNESERFRIPRDLRDAEVKPQRESWAVRQQDALTTGATGTNSCSAVGANGATGCFVRQATAARAERRQQKEAAENLPLP